MPIRHLPESGRRRPTDRPAERCARGPRRRFPRGAVRKVRPPVIAAVSAVRSRTPAFRQQFPSPRRQYLAVATIFVLDGAVSGTWAARIPDVSDRVGATHAALGSALFCVSLGALVSMRLAGGW